MTASQADERIAPVRRVLVWALTAEVAALLVTGVYLFFFYRPSAAQAWSDIYQLQEDLTFAMRVRAVHRWLSWLAVLTSLLLAAVLVAEAAVRWHGPRRRRRGAATGPATLLVVVAAAVTGTMLPWDQVALWAVTVGTHMSGYRVLLDDDGARFVIIGGSEVSLGSLRAVLALHAAVLPLLLVGLLWASGHRSARSARSAAAPQLGADRQDVVIAAMPPEPHTG